MGRMHLGLYHTVWPSWVSQKKYEVLKMCEESSSWILARSLSLKRANQRWKEAHHHHHHHHHHGADSARYDENKTFQSIDAMFFLYGPDWFGCQDFYTGGKKGRLFIEDGQKDSNGLWIGDLASVTNEGSESICGLEVEGGLDHAKDVVMFDDKEKGELYREDDRKDSSLGEKLASMESDFNCGIGVEGDDYLGSKDAKFEDKEIVFSVVGEENEIKKVSKEDRGAKRVDGNINLSEITNMSVKESIALIKHSFNPYKDFRDSMVEMILGSNIVISNSDLEELLYCYLSLNSSEHHDMIKMAFMDIWFELQAS